MAAHSSILAWKIPWTVAYQAVRSIGFSRQEYWSGLPFLSPGDLPNPGIEPESPELQVDSLLLNHWGSPKTFSTKGFLGARIQAYSPFS